MRRPKLSLAAQLLIGIPTLIVVGYSAATYSGPYRWISELQMRWLDGSYDMRLSVLGSALLMLVPLLPLALWWDAQRGAVPGQKMRLSRAMSFALVGLGVLGFGGYQMYRAHLGAVAETRKIAAVNATAEGRTGHHLTLLDAQPLLDETVGWRERRKTVYYVPLVGPTWNPGEAVKVVGYGDEYDVKHLQEGAPLAGLIDLQGMPGDVRSHWDSTNAPLAEDVLVVDLGEDASKQRFLAMLLGGFGGVMTIGGGAVHVLRRRG